MQLSQDKFWLTFFPKHLPERVVKQIAKSQWLMLVSLEGKEFTYAIRFDFKTTNNEAKYEALLTGIHIVMDMQIKNLDIYVDSQFMANQVKGIFEARKLVIREYLEKIKEVKAVLMANLSSYESDVLSEVPHSKNTHTDMLNQSVQEILYSEQTHLMNYPKNEITSDSNIIPYSQCLLETQNAVVLDINSFAQQDVMILSLFEQLSNQVTNCNKVNKDNLKANESLSAELERYKERFTDLKKFICLKQTLSEQSKEKELLTKTFNVFKNKSKEKEAKNIDTETALEKKVKELDNIIGKMGQSMQTMHMLMKPQVLYDNNLKQSLGFQNPFYLKKSQQIRLMPYDGNVIAKKINAISIADFEEILMIKDVVQIVLWYVDSGCSKHMTEDHFQLTNFIYKFFSTIKFGNDQIAKIMGYGDSDLETWSHTRSSQIEKYHLCLACAMSKSRKQSHKPKSEDTNQEILYLLHIDHCGPIRVASINGKKYILVIVDDYSQFTWVKFLASKDEAPDFINKILKMIQVRLNATVRNICRDNGTEIVNQTLPPGHQCMTPTTSSSGLAPNLTLQQPCNPPPRDNCDGLFQHMFDEYFNPSTIVVTLVQVVAAPRAVDLADSPMSMPIDQDAPSTSIPSSQEQEYYLIISQGFEESPKTPHFHDDPLHESLHEDSTSRNRHLIKKLQTDAMWGYFDAFLTSVEPKNFKQVVTEMSWIDAMQEEIHEFERLQVWELVPCPDKVMLMKLKWIYKVKTNEFGGVLKNKARLITQGFRADVIPFRITNLSKSQRHLPKSWHD
nr:integrase, catalytic region, zinc finger, CCHC-type, peptidase aspartic, catalytic [Tanacetum cinerariifolium]